MIRIIDFYSDTCIPCKAMSKILDTLAIEFPTIKIKKSNVVYDYETCKKFNINSLPTLIFLQDGTEVRRQVGLTNIGKLREIIQSLV